LHAGAGASEEFGGRIAEAKRFDDSGSVEIPGSFTGRDKNTHLKISLAGRELLKSYIAPAFEDVHVCDLKPR